jgi:hypothetical protein
VFLKWLKTGGDFLTGPQSGGHCVVRGAGCAADPIGLPHNAFAFFHGSDPKVPKIE